MDDGPGGSVTVTGNAQIRTLYTPDKLIGCFGKQRKTWRGSSTLAPLSFCRTQDLGPEKVILAFGMGFYKVGIDVFVVADDLALIGVGR